MPQQARRPRSSVRGAGCPRETAGVSHSAQNRGAGACRRRSSRSGASTASSIKAGIQAVRYRLEHPCERPPPPSDARTFSAQFPFEKPLHFRRIFEDGERPAETPAAACLRLRSIHMPATTMSQGPEQQRRARTHLTAGLWIQTRNPPPQEPSASARRASRLQTARLSARPGWAPRPTPRDFQIHCPKSIGRTPSC